MNFASQSFQGLHVAVIMDGNGRWAEARRLPRTAGHRAGVETVRSIVAAAPDLGIARLTLFAFSADNWRRPAAEVAALMALLQTYLASQTRQLAEQGMRVDFIGRRDRLPARLREAMDALEQATAAGTRLHLRIALDYSARAAIVRAAAASAGAAFTPQDFSLNLARASGADPAPCDVDLLIRTGGEKRLSDFLLWECAYAELWFTDTMWPDFTPTDLAAALADFRRRERRFGGLATVA